MITREEVLKNIDEIKKYISEIETKKEEKTIGIVIKNRFTGSIIFQSTKSTYKDAIIEKGDANLNGASLIGADLSYANLIGANLSDASLSDANLIGANLSYANLSGADLSDANLIGANLSDANLSGAELNSAKFYGKGGTKELKKSQLPDFLAALGFKILED